MNARVRQIEEEEQAKLEKQPKAYDRDQILSYFTRLEDTVFNAVKDNFVKMTTGQMTNKDFVRFESIQRQTFQDKFFVEDGLDIDDIRFSCDRQGVTPELEGIIQETRERLNEYASDHQLAQQEF